MNEATRRNWEFIKADLKKYPASWVALICGFAMICMICIGHTLILEDESIRGLFYFETSLIIVVWGIVARLETMVLDARKRIRELEEKIEELQHERKE